MTNTHGPRFKSVEPLTSHQPPIRGVWEIRWCRRVLPMRKAPTVQRHQRVEPCASEYAEGYGANPNAESLGRAASAQQSKRDRHMVRK